MSPAATDIRPLTLQQGRQQILLRRLPLFAIGWVSTTLAWGAVLMLKSRLEIFPAMLLFTFQLGILVAAISICHHRGSTRRVPLVVLASCVLLGLSSTGLFAAIGGYGEMLLFILLTLYLASSPLFAWSGRAALGLVVSTLLPWIVALPFLNFVLHPAELASAVAFGAVACAVTLLWARRDFHRAVDELITADARRDVTEGSDHPIFIIDEEGRFTYVNAALATLAGVPAVTLVGRVWHEVFEPRSKDGADPQGMPAGAGPFIPRSWTARTATGPRVYEIFTWPRLDAEGRPIGTCGVARDVVAPSLETKPGGQVPDLELGIALLREPLRLLKDDEVRRLQEEVGRLRHEVGEREREEHPRGRRRQKAAPGVAAEDRERAGTTGGDGDAFRFPERYRRKRRRGARPTSTTPTSHS